MSPRSVPSAAVLFLMACGGGPAADEPYRPALPTAWAETVDTRYLPFVPGTRWQYGGAESVTVEVLDERRTIKGVSATVVRDRVYEDGALVEDTYDWYAQDADGNVWYLGEDTREFRDGVVVSTAGSWEWGQDGALPGVVMWADPSAHLHERYRQEYRRGVAEDLGEVIAIGVTVTVPAGTWNDCIRTEDTSAIEPGAREAKTYCPGVGNVLETSATGGARVELLSHASP